MSYPYGRDYDEELDKKLIELALTGNKLALGELLQHYRDYIYNIAFKMVLSPYDAEDITQEIFIKIITKLDGFKGNSSFRTWITKITVNHVLDMKRKWLEERYKTSEMYEKDLDSICVGELYGYSEPEKQILYKEARIGCLAGMLLCLSRKQRIIYILGEVFSLPQEICAEALNLESATFRKGLSRARADLQQFMNEKCGLINKNNPCRCKRKTKGFIEAGWVDPKTMKFYSEHYRKICECAINKDKKLKEIEETDCSNIMRSLPYVEDTISTEYVERLLKTMEVKSIFEL